MKKIIMLALVLTAVTATSFALDPIKNINDAVLKSFNKEFKNAHIKEWTNEKEFVRAKFIADNQEMYAYFKKTGELMAVTRNIERSQLPIGLCAILKEKYSGYYLVSLFEVMKDGESIYYATVRNTKRSVTLQSLSSQTWLVYKKQKL